MLLLPGRSEMERAYLAGDASYDRLFFTAVRTTGIFCLPSCPARKPLPQNVEFFGTVKEALFAGYRPCKRCHPVDSAAPEWIAPLLQRIEASPSVRIAEADLREMGLDPGRVRRHFLREYAMTFQAYCRARRLGYAFEQLRSGENLDEAVFSSSFESHSGFRSAFGRFFGKPPGQTRESDCIRLGWIESPIGPLVAGAVNAGICFLEFTDRRMLETQLKTLGKRFGLPALPGDNEHLTELRKELAEYFAGARQVFDVPLVRPGTPYEQQVWTQLLNIPYGETRSYSELACMVGSPNASRAVGRANGVNRIAILIPCHRVVNKNGDLCGYGGGLWRKRLLLNLEQEAAARTANAAQAVFAD